MSEKEAELKTQQALKILNNSSVVVFLWKNEENWPVEFVTDNVSRVFGHTAEEFISGKVRYSGIIHPDDLERVAAEVADNSRQPDRNSFEHAPYRIVRPEGSLRWVSDRTEIRRDAQGKITHYQGIVEDITIRRRADRRMKRFLKYEKCISGISSRFARTEISDDSIMKALGDIGGMMAANRVYIYTINDTKQTMSNDYKWAAPGDTVFSRDHQNVPLATFPWWLDRLRKGKIISIRDTASLPPEATAEKAIMQKHRINNMFILPLYVSGRLYGFIGVNNPSQTRHRHGNDLAALCTIAEIIGGVLDRRKREFTVRERTKELQCFYSISEVVNRPEISFDEILGEIAAILPESWQYPEITAAAITIDNHEYKTKNFTKTGWMQTAEISTSSGVKGSIAIAYLEERPECDEGPFLKDERQLINAVAERLGNIVDTRLTAMKLKQSQQELSDAFRALGGISMMVDKDYTVENINQKGTELLGKSRNETIGRKCYQVLNGRQKPCDYCPLDKTLTGKNNAPTHIYHKGFNRYLSINITPVMDEDGRLLRFIDAIYDITSRVEAQQEREKLMQQVKQKSREMEQIISVSSHDLRSPLVNIQGFSQEIAAALKETRKVLQDEKLSPEAERKLAELLEEDIPESFGYILAGAGKMDKLLSGLLRLSRLGRAAIEFKEIDMNEMVDEVIRAGEYEINEKKVSIEVGKLPNCRGDEIMLNQVFSNLVGNALKYLEPVRPGKINISGYIDNNETVYCVADNGIGIAPEHQQKVFDIFHRLNPDDTQGEGLGLSIVSRILERHEGRIWLESEAGKGCKFYVALPNS